jgi:hypothetical protein
MKCANQQKMGILPKRPMHFLDHPKSMPLINDNIKKEKKRKKKENFLIFFFFFLKKRDNV